MGFDYYYGLPLTNLHDFGDDGLAVFWRNRPIYAIALSNGAIFGFITSILLLYYGFNPFLVFLFFFLTSVIPGSFYLLFANLKLLNSVLMRQGEIVEQPIVLSDLTPRLVKESSTFIRNSMKEEKPFLVVMSWIQVHTALITMPRFHEKSKHGRYGDAVEELDWSVGKMLDLLEELGIAEDTFIYFGSDNAAHIEEQGIDGSRHGGYNGNLRGGKFHSALEGAVRVPGIVSWPSKIPKGKTAHQATLNMDIFPTVAKIMDQKDPQNDVIIDGKDMMPILTKPSENIPELHEFIFHYCGDVVHGVRFMEKKSRKTYKYHLFLPNYIEGTEECYFLCACGAAQPQNPPVLYDITKDDTERNNIDPSSAEYKTISNLIEKALAKHDQSMDHNIPSQFAWENQLWRPWLQPCCGGLPFPFCGCRDDQDVANIIAY